MFQNYLKVTLRHLFKHKSYALINTLGLAIGMAGCLLIAQYVTFEVSYDGFHEHADRVYRLSYSKEKKGVRSFDSALTYAGVGRLMKESFPEVQEFARLVPSRGLISTESSVFEEEDLYFADPSYLTMFSLPLLRGDPATALDHPYTVILSETAAHKYFGDADPIGQTLRFDSRQRFVVRHRFEVSGVFEDVPENTHLGFDYLFSYITLIDLTGEERAERNLGVFHSYLYLLLDPQADPEALADKFPQFVDDHVGGEALRRVNTTLTFEIQPLQDIHFYSHRDNEAQPNGNSQTVYLLAIIGLLILTIAWINYVNLSTTRSMERAREVGMRKVAGAVRSQLTGQFLLEAALLNAAALAIAVLLATLGQPYFLQLTGLSQGHSIWSEPWFWTGLVLMFLVGTFLAGIYPAFTLSAYKPVRVLKGVFSHSGSGVTLRKVLVIFQFAASVALLVGTGTVYQQVQFMRDQDLGFNMDEILVVQGPLAVDSTYATLTRAFKSELARQAAVKRVSVSRSIPGRTTLSSTWFLRSDAPDQDQQYLYISYVDEEFLETYEIDLLQGRNFSTAFGTDDRAVMLNETALERLGFTSPEEALKQRIRIPGAEEDLTIIGVIPNFHQFSLRSEHIPLLLLYTPASRHFFSLRIQITAGAPNLRTTLDAIETTWNATFPGNPFTYFFLDDDFDRQYRADERFGEISGLFALLAVLVAGLGLFGLSSFVLLQRTKEIGVRKVLGSSVSGILWLLSKDLIHLVLISCTLAWPMAYLVMRNWLNGFAYRINLDVLLFALSGVLVLAFALTTVSYLTWKAARANPVEALRYE
jgi:putative ABC transport system permease protein